MPYSVLYEAFLRTVESAERCQTQLMYKITADELPRFLEQLGWSPYDSWGEERDSHKFRIGVCAQAL